MLLVSPFVIFSLYDLYRGEAGIIDWVSLFFFGAGGLVGLYLIFDRRPVVIISEIGILDKRISKKVFNWEIIQDAYLNMISDQWFICLIIDDTVTPHKDHGTVYRILEEFNVNMGFQKYNILVSPLNAKREKLLALILSLRILEKADRVNEMKMLLSKSK